jgi:hypothetical protein
MDGPKIIQLLLMPDNSTWQGTFYGLGDDGVVYALSNQGEWKPDIPPIGTSRGVRGTIEELKDKYTEYIEQAEAIARQLKEMGAQ